jgi:DNA ligase 1
MREFAELITQLDQTNKTNAKVDALVNFFKNAPEEDKLWGIAILTGRRPRRTVNTTQLQMWAIELSGIPSWLFDESYNNVGDLSETIALLLPEPQSRQNFPLNYWMNYLKALKDKDDENKKEDIKKAWLSMNHYERFVFNKLITGGFRIGVSQQTVINALSKYSGISAPRIAHRLMGLWDPEKNSFSELLSKEDTSEDISRPYPFYLAYQIDNKPEDLGTPEEWQAEWKWDGIRGQIIKRGGEIFVWSRGEELVTERFPEFYRLKEVLADGTVIDGEILGFKNDMPLPFSKLQTRIGRKKADKKLLNDVPVILYAYDLLEHAGADLRELPLIERRQLLSEVIHKAALPEVLRMSPELIFNDWKHLSELRSTSRANFSEGIMLKRYSSPYETGRKKGNWWKWKIDPFTVDAVLIYAQPGSGRRAGLFTDYTFAVWNKGELVPFAKAYSGLTDKEIAEVDKFVRQNTLEKFGPVRSVKPQLVFEIGFEGISRSSRHKSGIALRFPRMLRWRKDKPAEEADSLENLFALLNE